MIILIFMIIEFVIIIFSIKSLHIRKLIQSGMSNVQLIWLIRLSIICWIFYSEHYEMLFRQMSERQRLVFTAITKVGRAQNITGGAFIKKYQLWSASSVMSAVKALLDKDYITQEGYIYFVYDQFFALWLLRRNWKVIG